MSFFRFLLVAVLLLTSPVGFGTACAQWDEIPDEAADDQAIESGKRGLGSITQAPWYDAANDDTRSVKFRPDVKPTPPPTYKSGPSTGSNIGAGDFEIFGWMLFAVVLFILLFLIIKYLSRGEEDFRTVKKAEPGKVAVTVRLEDLPVQLSPTVHDPWHEAKRLAAEGRLAEATIYLYSHILIKLTEAGLIQLAKGKTNRRYLVELSGHERIERYFYGAMTMFEDSYFGHHPPTIERFNAVADEWPRIAEHVARISGFGPSGRGA
ncbi:MAG: hypothetical protein QM811_00320 [Pirellulales bacterium]